MGLEGGGPSSVAFRKYPSTREVLFMKANVGGSKISDEVHVFFMKCPPAIGDIRQKLDLFLSIWNYQFIIANDTGRWKG